LRAISDNLSEIHCSIRKREPSEFIKNILIKENHRLSGVAQPLLTALIKTGNDAIARNTNEEGSGIMSVEKPVSTTLGELIVAVTDQVAPLTANRATTNALVSFILQDLFLKRRVRLRKRSALRRV
jgi:hypothetical protein